MLFTHLLMVARGGRELCYLESLTNPQPGEFHKCPWFYAAREFSLS